MNARRPTIARSGPHDPAGGDDVSGVLRLGRLGGADGQIPGHGLFRPVAPSRPSTRSSARPTGTSSIAAIIAPLFVGLVADRFLPGQIVLGVLHLLGAGLLFGVAQATDPVELLLAAAGLRPLLHADLGARQLGELRSPLRAAEAVSTGSRLGHDRLDRRRDHRRLAPAAADGRRAAGGRRVAHAGRRRRQRRRQDQPSLSAGCGRRRSVLGLYCFTLPNSPPKAEGEPISVAKLLGLDAVGLMKAPAFAMFAIASFLICIPLAVYYSKANEYIRRMNIQEMLGLGSETVMTFGQMSEIGFMLLMPLFLARYGVKTMLLVGMLAWVARYVLFAYGGETAWMLVAGGGAARHLLRLLLRHRAALHRPRGPQEPAGQRQGLIALFDLRGGDVRRQPRLSRGGQRPDDDAADQYPMEAVLDRLCDRGGGGDGGLCRRLPRSGQARQGRGRLSRVHARPRDPCLDRPATGGPPRPPATFQAFDPTPGRPGRPSGR